MPYFLIKTVDVDFVLFFQSFKELVVLLMFSNVIKREERCRFRILGVPAFAIFGVS